MSLLPRDAFFPSTNRGGSANIYVDPPRGGYKTVSASAGIEMEPAVEWLARSQHAGARHKDLHELVANLRPYKSLITILGHGSNGDFEIGEGQVTPHPRNSLEYVNLENRATWEGPLAELKGDPLEGRDATGTLHRRPLQLMLLCCSVAQNEYGVNLVRALQEVTGRAIYASNGLIYATPDGHYVQKGCGLRLYMPPGQWGRILGENNTVASMTSGEGYAMPPLLDEALIRSSASALFETENAYYSGDDLDLVRVTSYGGGSELTREIVGTDAEILLKNLFFSTNFKKDGASLGMITHKVVIHRANDAPISATVFSSSLVEIDGTLSSCLASAAFSDLA